MRCLSGALFLAVSSCFTVTTATAAQSKTGTGAKVRSHAKAHMRESPVNKVIQMLSDMLAKGKETKGDEEVEFAKYKQFCESTRAEKSPNIEKAKAHITQLEADIEEATSTARDSDADITQWEEAMKKGKALREEQHADFQKTHKDYSESVEALARAKQTVKQAASFSQIEPSLIQLSSKVKRMPERARRMITSFLQSGGSTLQEGEPMAGNNLFVVNDDN